MHEAKRKENVYICIYLEKLKENERYGKYITVFTSVYMSSLKREQERWEGEKY